MCIDTFLAFVLVGGWLYLKNWCRRDMNRTSASLYFCSFARLTLSSKKKKKTLFTLYNEPNIIAVAKSHRLRWAGHIARMNEASTSYKLLEGNP